MNRKEFEEALMSTIVEYISDQVILRYAQACKKATVLFSGALIGYKDAVTSLNELKKDGWTLTAVLSKAAGEVQKNVSKMTLIRMPFMLRALRLTADRL